MFTQHVGITGPMTKGAKMGRRMSLGDANERILESPRGWPLILRLAIGFSLALCAALATFAFLQTW
jgi:hypothetical protein